MDHASLDDILGKLEAHGIDAVLAALPEGVSKRALSLSRDVLAIDTGVLPQVIMGRLARSRDPHAVGLVAQARAWARGTWLRPLATTLEEAESALLFRRAEHGQLVQGLAVSPDGSCLVSSSEDGSAIAWDLPAGEPRHRLDVGSPINCASFARDGRRVALASDDTTIRIWNVETNDAPVVLAGHGDYVSDVVVTPLGQVVSCSKDGTVRVWDLESGKQQHLLEGHARWVFSLAVSPDGRWAATASENNVLYLWNLTTGERVHTLCDFRENFIGDVFGMSLGNKNHTDVGHADAPHGLAFSADGTRLFSAEHTLIEWEVATGKQLRRLPLASQSATAMALLPGGLIATSDSAIRVWDSSGALRSVIPAEEDVKALALSDDGTRLFAGLAGGGVAMWDLALALERPLPPRHTARADVWIHSALPLATTSGSDGEAQLWDLATGNRLLALAHGEPYLEGARLTNDGARLMTATMNGELSLWDARTGQRTVHHAWTHVEEESADEASTEADADAAAEGVEKERFGSVAGFELAGERAVIGVLGVGVWTWALEDTPPSPLAGRAKQSAFVQVSRDGRLAITQSYFGEDQPRPVHVWDLARKCALHALTAADGDYVQVLLLADGSRLVGLGGAGNIEVVDLVDGTRTGTVTEDDDDALATATLTELPGNRVAVVRARSLRVFDVASAKMTSHLPLPFGSVTRVSANADGTRLLVRGDTGIALVDTARAELLAWFFGDGEISAAAIAPDGTRIIAAEPSGRVHVLEVAGTGVGTRPTPNAGDAILRRAERLAAAQSRATEAFLPNDWKQLLEEGRAYSVALSSGDGDDDDDTV